ncbi:MAG: hypothetical protein IPF54_06780 [Draconibacterium sp.]|nr:hypothetical protein [Draconibacterium sp.]
MNQKSVFLIIVLLFTVSGLFSQTDNNWTHFRGTNLDGHANVAKAPLQWSDSTNIEWKVPVKGLGWSSPVVLTTKSG